MAEILELVCSFVAIFIYGSESRPRHPIWRNSFRIIAFGGSISILVNLLTTWSFPDFASPLILPWLLCSIVVLLGEYYVGSKRLGVAASIVALLLILVAFVQLDIL